jgi:HD domain
MGKQISGIEIPDSKLCTEAAEILRQYGSSLLWNHSHRVYLFGALQGQKCGLKYDAELLYIGAIFHDLGLTKRFRSPNKRFEVDSANAARSFLELHDVPKQSIQLVWDSIALHTTIGISQYKEPEVALVYSGVGFDVMGENFHRLSADEREQVVAAYPRDGFKYKILPVFLKGFAHKPETTFGNINADVCACLLPGFKRIDFCDLVLNSPWDD